MTIKNLSAWRFPLYPTSIYNRSLCLHTSTIIHSQYRSTFASTELDKLGSSNLPKSCPGCGAYANFGSANDPGCYNLNRKSVQAYLDQSRNALDRTSHFERAEEDAKASSTNTHRGPHEYEKLLRHNKHEQIIAPTCDRCHHLLHHSDATPVAHPSTESLRDIISESPHKYNHIYHVLDAADFPMSLIPNLQRRLSLNLQRSVNRRAKPRHGTKMDLTFIITRSDLLAPRKEQVDGLMPYLVQVLRNALGRAAENARLGNVRCVSAKRGWWTPQVKEEIWKHGGGSWMVGKVNVGKSNLLENILPKGRTAIESARTVSFLNEANMVARRSIEPERRGDQAYAIRSKSQIILEDSLLPPAPRETKYPVLPLVSPIPGTTAAPIRLPYGDGKGELIDLPGVDRADLGRYLAPGDEQEMIMRSRPKPQQLSIKPGESLLVGGLVRVTPSNPDVTFLAYPFLPFHCHVASTDHIIALQARLPKSKAQSEAASGMNGCIDLAGKIELKWDVTKERAGPLIRKDAAGLNANRLPFVVFSVDLLIEGSGWIELVAQVRKRNMGDSEPRQQADEGLDIPWVEVHSPEGRHIGVRRPMNAWLLHKDELRTSRQRLRPRRSMKGFKKQSKDMKRDALP